MSETLQEPTRLSAAWVRRQWCVRCRRRRGAAVWDVCAEKNQHRVICWPCDKALNRLVLRWMRDPEWREKCAAYERRKAPEARS